MNIRKHNSQSLLPYLDPANGKLFLKVSLCSDDPSVLEKVMDPFMMISQSGPLARIVEAQFATDLGSKIKKVFLLVQKDKYHFTENELWPLNNKDIDQCWQNAISHYFGGAQDDSTFLLSGQMGNDGTLLPFQSLFFCKLRQIFFHPLCPKCGSAIEQCQDDERLKALGLQAYSTSTRRYLFCSSCLDADGESDFYTLSPADDDPPIVKDCPGLIKDLGAVTGDRDQSAQFPCDDCGIRRECYGADGLATSRIVPFSFYPFYLLIFDGASLNAVDFLSLVSGASFEELETSLVGKQQPGRVNCLKELKSRSLRMTPFFFQENDRYFLEVLYLKLSFLTDFSRMIISDIDNFRYPDFGISIDRIWVKLADQGGLLPFFWDFNIKFIDVAGSATKTSAFPKVPPYYGLYLLGLVWYYILLTNREQDIKDVYGVIGRAMEETAPDNDVDLNRILRSKDKPVFYPENVFWDPNIWRQRPIPDAWKQLWEVSLGLGWSLLTAGLHGSPGWSKEEFFRNLETTREDIRYGLFQKSTPAVQTEPEQENAAIRNILAGIADKWRMDLETTQDSGDKTVAWPPSSDSAPGPTKAVFQGAEDLQQTVMLSDDRFEKQPTIPVQEEPGLDETLSFSPETGEVPRPSESAWQDNEDVQQTVILSSDWHEKEVAPPVQEENGFEKTVILTPSSGDTRARFEYVPQEDEGIRRTGGLPSKGAVKEPVAPLSEEETLDETVILSPDSPRREPLPHDQPEADLSETVILSPGGLTQKTAPPSETQESDIPETVIFSPAESEKARRHVAPAKPQPPQEDSLDETVILRPGKPGKGNRP